MRGEGGLSGEDEKLATEKIHDGRGAYEHALGEDAWKSEPPDEERSSQQADQEAESCNGGEDRKLHEPGVTSGDEDKAGIEKIGNLVGEGKGDQIVDDEILLTLGISDGLTLDGRPVHGRNHGAGEGHGDEKEKDGAGDSTEPILHELHENRSVAGLNPASEHLLAGNFHTGGARRLNRNAMIA